MYKTQFDKNTTKLGYKKAKRGIEKKSIKLNEKEIVPERQTLLLQIKRIGLELQPELTEKMFKTITTSDLEPMFTILMTFLGSAMSHISVSHRLKGVQILELTLKWYPDLFMKYDVNFNPQFLSLLSVNKDRLLVIKTFSELVHKRHSFSQDEASKLLVTLVNIWIENDKIDLVSELTLSLFDLLLSNYKVEKDIKPIITNHFLPMFPFNNVDMNLRLVLIMLRQGETFLQSCLEYVESLLANLKRVTEILLDVISKLAMLNVDHSQLLRLALNVTERIFNKTTFRMTRELMLVNESSQASWLLKLPKHLWQLKHNDLEFSKEIIELMMLLVQKLNVDDLNKFQKVLAPMFHSPNSVNVGPILKYSRDLQENMVDLLFFLPTWDIKLCEAVAKMSQSPKCPTNISLRLFDICVMRQQSENCLDLGLYQSVLISIIVSDNSVHRKKLMKDQSVAGPLGKVFVSNSDGYKHQLEKCHELKQNLMPVVKNFNLQDIFANVLNEQIPLYTLELICELWEPNQFSDQLILAIIDASLIKSELKKAVERVITTQHLAEIFKVYETLLLENDAIAINSINQLFVKDQLLFDNRGGLISILQDLISKLTNSRPAIALSLLEIQNKL